MHEVNTAVNQLDQVTQQNAAMVEQATATSHDLADEAAELTRLIGPYHIDAMIAVEFEEQERAYTNELIL